MRIRLGQLDEAEDRGCGDRAAVLVVEPGPKRNLESFGKQRTAMFAIKFQADFANSCARLFLMPSQSEFGIDLSIANPAQ